MDRLPADVGAWPWVEVVASHAGTSARVLQGLIEQGVKGVVISASGNGSVHQALLDSLQTVFEQGRFQPRQVRVATRCALGGVVGQPPHGLPTAGLLTPAQARVALMLDLMRHPPAG